MLELHYVFWVPVILFEYRERDPVHHRICYELYLMLCSKNVLKSRQIVSTGALREVR